MPQPCQSCGLAPKKPGPGQRYCDECGDLKKDRHAAHRKLFEATSAVVVRAPTRAMKAAAPEGTAWCSGCQRYRSLAHFGRASARCRDCTSLDGFARRIAESFGLTPADYFAALDHQGGGCAICGNRPGKLRLAVDHNHRTGEVRGLLCKRCNRDLLGRAHDNPDILRRAADYLDSPPARAAFGVPRHVPEGKAMPARRPRRRRSA